MATETRQRSYRAACPGCGAPVEFRNAQSTHAVCGYCQSTVVRQGEVLSRLGRMAELFDDHSPLRLLASGKWSEQGFTLVGRLQYRSDDGRWTEWMALLDDGTQAVLSEDNGAYVFTRPFEFERELPGFDDFRLGATTAIAGKRFTVSTKVQAALVSAQGELPRLPPIGQAFGMVELRSDDGEVVAIDFGTQPAALHRGRAVLLEELQLAGLAQESGHEEQGRQFACPQCGATVAVKLANSKSITCTSCNSLIDLSGGLGGELGHALQREPVAPLIALGSQGQLQGRAWQVVGFQHRMGHEPGGSDEHFGWSEYLLYNLKRGFIFVVDTEDGWSVVKPTTGAPVMNKSGEGASYLGTHYRLKYSYQAETTYVAGEFYWQVRRGQTSFNRDFENGNRLLAMEQTPDEITWSSGSKVSSDTIAKAFKLDGRQALLQRGDVLPAGGAAGLKIGTQLSFALIALALVATLSFCSDCDPATQDCSARSGGSRSFGGSYGGGSSGGGHK